ncbi:MAG: metal ABC transporter substrate-binding protein [Fibrobacteraceae bacterium]|nr:metal ABC transporter substrate-binding protein [Fibrobacteraceae bacterium]
MAHSKHILPILCAILALICVGCNDKAPRTQSEDKVILASFYPMYISTKNVAEGVPGITVKNMTPPQTGCLHDYQLTPKDLQNISHAWMFIANGGGMENFLAKVISKYPNLNVVEASKGITLIAGEGSEGPNPHVWVSVSNAITQVQNIADALSAKDSAHAELYKTNAARYIQKLESLKTKMHQGLDSIPSRDIITFHEAFPYFAQEFNLNIAAVIEREPGSEPSSGELAATIETIKEKKVKALFAEPQYPAKAAETIARETGAQVYTLDPAVSGPDSLDAYIQIMENNLSVLQKALK